MKVEDYLQLKSSIEHLRQRKARAEGALEQAEKRLRRELGVSVEEAEEQIVELEEKVKRTRRQVERRLDEFDEKWGEKLGEIK